MTRQERIQKTINELCDADKANTNYLIRRVRNLFSVGYLNKITKTTEPGKQLTLF